MSKEPVDYCTGWFEGIWASCCKQHDKNYYLSGVSRKACDTALRLCVIGKFKHTRYPFFGYVVGYTMYAGVRIFGGPRYKKKQER